MQRSSEKGEQVNDYLLNKTNVKTFEANKNAQELGIDTTRKFIVVKKDGEVYKVGDIVELIKDGYDTSPYPSFLLDGKELHISWKNLYYADNTVVAHGQVFQKVYVSDESVEDAIEKKRERILLYTLPGNTTYKYLVIEGHHYDDFISGKYYGTTYYAYIAEIPLSPPTKKVTVTIDGEQKEIEITEEELNKLLNR